MAHSNNIITSIKLPNSNTVYEIHDAQAIHSIEELGLSAALVFKGTKATDDEILALTSAKVGDVWLSIGSNNEYVCVSELSGTANTAAWEKLGGVFDSASSSHTHNVTVTGTNEASEVTGTVTVPTVSKTQKYMTASAGAPAVTPSDDKVLGANTVFNVSGGKAATTKIKATATDVAVDANGTAAAITGFGAHTTAAAITALNTTTINNPTVTSVSIPNVTGNESVTASKIDTNSDVVASKIDTNSDVVASKVTATDGTAASWTATVSTDGVLSFDWTANTPTAVTATDVTASKVTATDVTASKVTASDVSATKVTLGTALSASSVTTDNVTVATGSKTTADAITALGAPTIATTLTGVKVTAQPVVTLATDSNGDVEIVNGISDISVTASGDEVTAITGVTVAAPAITLANNDSSVAGSVPVVSAVEIGAATANLNNGIAAAQKWTQASGATGTPQ